MLRHRAITSHFVDARAFNTKGIDLLMPGCVWLLMVLLVNPVGEFPLNDDWSYSRAVQSLISRGQLQFSGFTAMPLVAQVVWGALFCLPFGFSFTALRVSTLVLGVIGIFTTYNLLKEIISNRSIALLGAMLVAVNPIYFSLSFTFMTDVPFFTFSMLALLFFMRAIRDERQSNLLAGYLLACISVLIRQLGIIIPLAFAMVYLVKNGLTRKTLALALIPAALIVGILPVYRVLIQSIMGLPQLYNRAYDPITESLEGGLAQTILVLADRFLVQFIYVGLFLLPFLLLVEVANWRIRPSERKPLRTLIYSAITLVVTVGLMLNQRLMPLTGNILFDVGVGPPLLRDVYLLGLPHLPTAPKDVWLVITAAGVAGAVLISTLMMAAAVRLLLKSGEYGSGLDRWSGLFVLSVCVLYSSASAFTGFLDRYLIFLLPPLMIVALSARLPILLPASSRLMNFSWLLIFMYGVFSVGSTHDYMAWNRSRWEALHYLVEEKRIPYTSVDGGFEFNGWYAYDPEYRQNPPKSWWWVQDDDYVVAFGPIADYTEMRRYSHTRWLPFGQGSILILHRVARTDKK